MWVPASLSGDVALVAQITAVLLESWVRGRSSILNALHSQESLLLELLSLKTLVSYSQCVFPQLGKKGENFLRSNIRAKVCFKPRNGNKRSLK